MVFGIRNDAADRGRLANGRRSRFCLAFLASYLFLILSHAQQAIKPRNSSEVVFSISKQMFRDVNENDARASVKAYARQLAEIRGFVANPNPEIFADVAGISALLKAEAVDIVSLPAAEFLMLDDRLVSEPILVSVLSGLDYEEYVILVPKDSPSKSIADLKGSQLLFLDSLNGCYTKRWLEVLLHERGLEASATFFGRITSHNKTSQTLLPVYFRQADACLVTRQGFKVMGELNPQIVQKLRILETSPQIVPHVTFFRRGLDPVLKRSIQEAIVEAETMVSGKQLMTIFQCDRIVVRSTDRLQTTAALLKAYARLNGVATNAGSAHNIQGAASERQLPRASEP